MSYTLKKIFFLFLIGLSIIQASFNLSLYEKKKLAQTYYNSNLYDDAIIIYEEIFQIEKEIFDYNDLMLLETIKFLYELHELNNNPKEAKKYIQEYINVQSSYIIKQQKSYISPLEKLKKIYLNEKNPDFVFEIDSLLHIINSNTEFIKKDSVLVLPKLLINTIDSTNSETEYSNNDIALELINNGFNYLNNNLYTEAKIHFIDAIKLNAEILNISYFKNIDFGSESDNLYESFLDTTGMDTINNNYNDFYLGLLSFNKGEYINSKKYLINYNENHPYDINALLLLAELSTINQNLFDAMFYYYRSLKIKPEDLYTNKSLAKILIQLEDYNEAINILKYIYKSSNQHEIAYNLGYSYYQINNYDESIKYFTQAILMSPEDYKTYYYLGLSYKANALYKQAQDAFKKCISLNSNWGLGHYELGLIYEIILDDQLAIKHFELANKNENFDDLNYKLGMLYYKNENFYKAMKPLKEYLLKNMTDYKTMTVIGNIFIEVKRYPEAIDIYNRLIDIEPNNEKFYYNIANSYYMLNDFDNALEYYLRITELNEESYDIFIDIGIILNKKNMFQKAELYLLKALDCGYPNKNLLVQLGIAYGGQRKFLQSLVTFQEALKFSLEDPIIHYQIGVIYKELEIFDLAAKSFIFYLDSNKKDEIALSLIGECYLNMNNYEKAIQFFEKSYKLNNNYTSLFNIGKCYEKSGDLKNAAKFFKNVIKKNPDHVKSREQLIPIYKKLNKFREARKECEIIYMLDRSVYNSITFCRE
tara:strand:+ start:4748 stop:7030 length:2283 start_codon:yes stop_codon:yes gene_type:complete